jgi:ribosome maturation factor RimP
MSSIAEGLTQLVEPMLNAQGVELVDLTYRREAPGWVLRIYIEKPGGINLSDCETWSDEIGRMLDEKKLLDTSYTLEVSSPGINRPLKKQVDFERFSGERIEIKLFAPLTGRRHFLGILRGFKEGKVLIEDHTGLPFEIPLGDIAQARLDRDIQV